MGKRRVTARQLVHTPNRLTEATDWRRKAPKSTGRSRKRSDGAEGRDATPIRVSRVTLVYLVLKCLNGVFKGFLSTWRGFRDLWGTGGVLWGKWDFGGSRTMRFRVFVSSGMPAVSSENRTKTVLNLQELKINDYEKNIFFVFF